LRFLAEETKIVPRDRLLQSARLLLDNAQFADQIILDLARWEDWSVMDRLIEMFKTSDASGYVRTPIVAYLLAAVEQPGAVNAKANQALVELEKIDADAVKRARTQMAFGFLQRAKTVEPATAAQRVEKKAADNGDRSAATTNENDGFSASTAGGQGASTTERPPDPAAFVANTSGKSASSNTAGAAASAGSAQTKLPAAYDPLLVIGLPLAASVLLVAVFWIILRSNAV
jgi:hypothetical protein